MDEQGRIGSTDCSMTGWGERAGGCYGKNVFSLNRKVLLLKLWVKNSRKIEIPIISTATMFGKGQKRRKSVWCYAGSCVVYCFIMIWHSGILLAPRSTHNTNIIPSNILHHIHGNYWKSKFDRLKWSNVLVTGQKNKNWVLKKIV